jgi:TusA-related sulfurtransferase
MSPKELMTLYSDVVIDLRTESHAQALVELEQCACTVPLGDVMEVVSDDPAMSTDVCGWAEQRGDEYLGTVEEPGFTRIYVRRTH